MTSNSSINSSNVSRRDVIKTSAAVTAAAAFASLGSNIAHAAEGAGDKIRVGLIGCGGRGTGAAGDITVPNENVVLVAMADMFQDRIDGAKARLSKGVDDKGLGDKYQVKDDRCFTGFDAYKKVLGQSNASGAALNDVLSAPMKAWEVNLALSLLPEVGASPITLQRILGIVMVESTREIGQKPSSRRASTSHP